MGDVRDPAEQLAVDEHRAHKADVGLVGGADELLHGVERHGAAQAVAEEVTRTGGVHDGPDVGNLGGHGVVRGLRRGITAAAPVVDVHRPADPEALGQRLGKRPVDRCREEGSADHHHTALAGGIDGPVTVQSQPSAVVRGDDLLLDCALTGAGFLHRPILKRLPSGIPAARRR